MRTKECWRERSCFQHEVILTFKRPWKVFTFDWKKEKRSKEWRRKNSSQGLIKRKIIQSSWQKKKTFRRSFSLNFFVGIFGRIFWKMHFWNDLGLFAASPNFSSLQNIVTPFSPKPSSWIFIQPSKIDFRKRRTSAILCGWHKTVIKPRYLLRDFSFSFEKSVLDGISGNLLLRHLVIESTVFWGPLC